MNTNTWSVMGLLLLCINMATAQENEWTSARPDGHAPISVMGDHYHKKGEFMLSYRYMPMWMHGNQQSAEGISNQEIYKNYMVAPRNMQMNMHMFGMMYAPSNRITLALMGNYTSNSMKLRTKKNMDFTTKSGGLGDVTVFGLVKLLNKNKRSLHANIGVSIPTGNIDQRDATPMMANARLAYPMQLGSGTWNPILGLTYLGQTDKFSWGAQSKYKFRIGENTEHYTLGNQLNVVGWGAVKVSEYMSISTSISYLNTQSINGADLNLNPMMMPLFNSVNSGKSRLDLGLGSNFYLPNGKLKNLRITAEVKLPVYQQVNGVQMRSTAIATFGIQYAIGGHHKQEKKEEEK